MQGFNTESDNSWKHEGDFARVFSGHESFPCRFGWLPKLYEAVNKDPDLFANDENAILGLGLGRNMVKSLRFWGESFGLIKFNKQKVENTPFAELLLDPEEGIDPYLENLGSLWRLHWWITARKGIGAWVTLFLDFKDHQVSRDRLIELVCARASAGRGKISKSTATVHVDMLIRTYDWSKYEAMAPGEDIAGCPFQELHLIERTKVNDIDVIKLKRGFKNYLDVGAFAFALQDFWKGTASNSQSLSLRSLLIERRSPGVIFRLDEESMYHYLEEITKVSKFQLRPDGIGGMDFVALGQDPMGKLEDIAWQKL